METKVKSTINNVPLGLILGITIPFLTLVFINAEANRHLGMIEFLSKLHKFNKLSALFSLCAIPNLGLFFLFMWKNNYYSGRGVVIATILVSILVFALKFN